MAKFLLLNREEEFLQTLKNVTMAKENKVINGEDVLDLTLFDTDIEKNYRILLQDDYGKWHEYIVREIEEAHTNKGIRKKVFCESSFYETIGDFVEDRRFNNTSALIALTGVLEVTRWKVGRVDNLGTESYSPYRVDAKTAVQEIVKRWDGELQTRIEVSGNKVTNRYVDILFRIGYETGKRFTWTKDIQAIKRTVAREDVVTALYGFGKGEEVGDGFGRRLNFSEINDGKMYVENNEARERFGRLGADGTKQHIFGKVEFDEEEDKTSLKAKTEKELEVLSVPSVSYSAEVLDLKKFGYEHEGYELGDTVLIIDKEFKPELRVMARIIEKETDYLEELQSNVTLGNFIPTSTSEDLKNEGYINNFRDKSGVWDRSNYISEDGRIFIDDLLDQLNAKANATGGYFYYTEGEGTITTDRPIDDNPTMAVEIKGGSIRIADSKLPDGTWNWRTALTGKGIIADEINTGVLNAALIQAGFNDIAYGVIMTKDGMYVVAPQGHYSQLSNGGMLFYTKDDILNGRISSSYAGDKTGFGLFVEPGHGFSVVRNNPGTTPNKTIFEVPDDVDEFRLRADMNANGKDIKDASTVSAHDFRIKGTNQRIANIVGGGGAYFDTTKVSLGIGDDDGVSMKVTALSNKVEIYENLDMKLNNIQNAINLKPYNPTTGRESFFFTDKDGYANLGGGFGTNIGYHNGTSLFPVLKIPSNAAMVVYQDLNMNGKAITNQSDVRLKKNIQPTKKDALKEIDKMTFVDYEWDKENPFNKSKDEGVQFGQIAQHAPVMLQVQNGEKDHYLSINQTKQIDLNSMGIQQLNKELQETKKELAELKQLLCEKGLI